MMRTLMRTALSTSFYTLIDNGKLANQIARLQAIVVKKKNISFTSHGLLLELASDRLPAELIVQFVEQGKANCIGSNPV